MKSVLIVCFTFMLGSLSAQDFKSVSVQYKLNGKDKSNTIFIPQHSNDYKPAIRGVMQNVRGDLKVFAYKNHIALIAKLDEGRGFSKALLVAAAKASNRPEIEFAGAIVQGISKGGREAANWAAANKERAIAVILDHSAIWSMTFPKRVIGVPMYFNSTYSNLYQGIDRRQSHFGWCVSAYKVNQACTSIIDHAKGGGHGGRGSTDLTAIWLEEAMAFRVPFIVPVGKPYKLIDVDPSKVGGYVSAKTSKDGKRTYHDKVKISLSSRGASWWIPGPKTAAKYLEWVRENGGSVEKDESAGIKNFPIFIDLPANLKKVVALIKANQFSQALATLKKSKKPNDPTNKTLMKIVSSSVETHLSLIEKLDSSGDIYSVYMMIKNNSRMYKGIPAYNEKLQYYITFFKNKKNSYKLKQGRDFHGIIERINKTKKLSTFNLAPLRNFAKKYSKTTYGKAAQTAFDKLSADLTIKQSAKSYFIN